MNPNKLRGRKGGGYAGFRRGGLRLGSPVPRLAGVKAADRIAPEANRAKSGDQAHAHQRVQDGVWGEVWALQKRGLEPCTSTGTSPIRLCSG